MPVIFERDRSPYFGEGVLALADGRVFTGLSFGARATVVGEVVFNTAMTGYQEIITDASYTGQLVCLTVSEVGNVGTNAMDAQSTGAGAEGLLVRSLSPVVSSWRSERSLSESLAARGVPGLGEIDTRALTRHLRDKGAIMGALSTESIDAQRLVEQAAAAAPMEGRGLAHEVSTSAPYPWREGSWGRTAPDSADVRAVVVDFGVKLDILRRLVDEGVEVTVVPSTTSVDDILEQEPHGVVLSNGPGDPAALPQEVERIAELLRRAPSLPVFGICLGHQLMCLAMGGETYKLKFGHHGGNHPVRHDGSAAVEITSQNHGFAARAETFETQARVAQWNLFDQTVAGLRVLDRPHWSVQYHPEAAPGPHDSSHVFAEFAAALRRRRGQVNERTV